MKARNGENIPTGFGPQGCGTTSSGNHAPTLSWTGEPNYVSDGLHPETGNSSTDFIYRVTYTDSDNDAPKAGYPKVHILKGGVEISGSPYTMTAADGNAYNVGRKYTFTKNGLVDGTDYTYYFEAYDINNAQATGAPTTPKDAPDVISPQSIPLAYGWNMVSMPAIPSNTNVTSVFPGMAVYAWDCNSRQYFVPTNVTQGQGYWVLRTRSDTTITVTGSLVTSYTSTLCYGWNMIGATNQSVPFSSVVQNPGGCITQGLYWWNPSTMQYVSANTLTPARGYWVLANGGCQITVSNPAATSESGNEPLVFDKQVQLPIWVCNILIENKDSPNLSLQRGFGLSPEATGGFDVGFDTPLPPPAPGGGSRFDAYFEPDEAEFIHLARDIKGVSDSIVWTFVVESESGFELNWNPEELPNNIRVSLTRNLLDLDMGMQNFIHFENGGVYQFKIVASQRIGEEEQLTETPRAFKLWGSYPNPFNQETLIKYQIPLSTRVTLKIYNIAGQLVKTLLDEAKASGCYEVSWSGKDENGNPVSSGIYFCKMVSGQFSEVKKIVLLK